MRPFIHPHRCFSFQRPPGIAALSLVLPSVLFGQAVTSPPARPAADQVVELSPFVINAGADTGWVASSSLIGNRTNKPIADLPLSIDAITSDFMQDLGAYTLEDAGAFVGNMTTVSLIEDRSRDEGRVSYRGLESSSATAGGSTAQAARNFFTWYSPTDNYNVERIDFNKGSNSVMFGDASPGGQAATYTKRAQFRNFNQLTAMYGSYDSYRVMLDVNRKITDRLAARANFVTRAENTYLDGVGQELNAGHFTVTYQPWKNTQVRAEVERGRYYRTRGSNQVLLRQNSAPGLGLNTTNRWFYTTDGAIYNRTSFFNNLFPAVTARDGAGPGGLTLSALEGTTTTVPLFTSSAPTSATAVATGRSITFPGRPRDTSLYPTDSLTRPYTNGSIWVLQNFGKLGVELAFNKQTTRQSRNDTSTSSTVAVDGNGRPYVDQVFSEKDYTTRANIARATVSYPFDFGRFGSQYLVLTAANQQDNTFRWRWELANFAVTENPTAPVNIANHRIIARAYLDDPEFGTDAFWARLRPSAMPNRPGFRQGYYLNGNAVNPFFETGYTKSYSASSAGTYFNNRLHSIFGVRYDTFKRKMYTSTLQDNIGQFVFLGRPEDAPGAYSYDRQSDLQNTSYSAGLSYNVMRGFNLYANYSTSFRWQSAQLFTGENPGAVIGETSEVGLKGSLFENRLFFTVAAYDIQRDNSVYIWSGGPDQDTMENLFNPNDVLPSDPRYFNTPDGANSEFRTTRASESSRGAELTLQVQRTRGVQARVTVSYNEVTAQRDFTTFRTLLEAATTRTSAALAPGGNPAMAENQADLDSARLVLLANDGVATITGNRSTPWAANWLFDYEFDRSSPLKGTRVALYGNWRDNYNLSFLNNRNFRGGASHPVGAYAIHRRKVFERPTSFRLGFKNIYDLQSGSDDVRRSAVVAINPDGSTINQYRYVNPLSWDFTVTVDF